MSIWSYEYEETGGYDCMTGAFVILKGGKEVALIDQNDFGQEPCNYCRIPEAEEAAKFIVAACNKAEPEA
jgi:hypothetical protein